MVLQWFANIQLVVANYARCRLACDLANNPSCNVEPGTASFPAPARSLAYATRRRDLYFSPSRTFNGFTWGLGHPLLPTGTEQLLDAGNGAQARPGFLSGRARLVGPILANHDLALFCWRRRPRRFRTRTYLLPLIAYTTPQAWTSTLPPAESDFYDWETWQMVGTDQLHGCQDSSSLGSSGSASLAACALG